MVPFYCENKHTGIGSAIEYAICVLEVKVIVVIGHSCCGGIKTILSLKDGADDSFKFVEDWVGIGLSAKRKVEDEYSGKPPEEQCAFLEKAVVDVSLDNLRTYPFVKDGVDNGTVKLVGGHYDFVSGKFDTWKATTLADRKMDSDEKRLRTGFDKFRTEVYDKKPDLFERLKTKQKPR
uniref:Carbonic anhydrase n=1 Tax=Triticum urartu TaxID=4572 RepID=A0A8R7R706_TRIUA